MTKLLQASGMPIVDGERAFKNKLVLVLARPHHTRNVKNLEHFSLGVQKIGRIKRAVGKSWCRSTWPCSAQSACSLRIEP